MMRATAWGVLVLGIWGLTGVAAIAGGLLIFLKGRAHVRRKYGDKR